MLNHHRGEVEITIGGRAYIARFDFNAIVCLETHFGSREQPKPLQEIFVAGRTVPSSFVPVVIWACLNTHHIDTFPDVRSVACQLDLAELEYYSGRVADLMRYSQEAMTAKKPGARPTPAASAQMTEPQVATTGMHSDGLPPRSDSERTSSGG